MAVVERAWKRTKTRFEDVSTKIGLYSNTYYYYIGPPSFDITALSDSDSITVDGVGCTLIEADGVKIGSRVQYYRGVLKKSQRGDGDVFA